MRTQDSDDIRYMVAALKELGLKLEEDWANSKLTVHGCAGTFPSGGAELSLGNAGTAMRPLTAAVAAAGRGEFVLDGVARMRERPIQDLVDGLQQLGEHTLVTRLVSLGAGSWIRPMHSLALRCQACNPTAVPQTPRVLQASTRSAR